MKVEGQRHLGKGPLMALIIILCFFPPLSTDMFLSDMPNMAAELGTDPSTMNMVLYGYIFSLAVSILVFGPITDRYGRKPVLFFATAEYIVWTVAGSMVDDIYILIAFRVLQGIGSGAAMTVSTALIKDCFRGPAMQKVLFVTAVMGVLAPLIAPILGSWIISFSDWRWAMAAPAFLGVVCLVMTALLTETVTEEHRAGASIIGNFRKTVEILSDRAFTAFLILATVFHAVFMGYLSVSSYIYEETFGCAPMEYSMYLAAALIGGTLLMVPVNRVWRAVGNVRAIPMYLILVLLSALLMFTVADRGSIWFYAAFLPCVTVTSAVRPYGMGIVMASRDGDNGLISSLINFMIFFMGVIGMAVSTMFPDFIQGLGLMMVATSVIYVAMWAALKFMGYRLRSLAN